MWRRAIAGMVDDGVDREDKVIRKLYLISASANRRAVTPHHTPCVHRRRVIDAAAGADDVDDVVEGA